MEGITGKTQVRTCDHRITAHVEYLRNDPTLPPILYVEGFGHWPALITLTNQIIRVSCPVCFQQITKSLEPIYSRDNVSPQSRQ